VIDYRPTAPYFHVVSFQRPREIVSGQSSGKLDFRDLFPRGHSEQNSSKNGIRIDENTGMVSVTVNQQNDPKDCLFFPPSFQMEPHLKARQIISGDSESCLSVEVLQ
jgi:hypothetical protein